MELIRLKICCAASQAVIDGQSAADSSTGSRLWSVIRELSARFPAELLGHARLETARVYTRPTAEDRSKAVDLPPVDE